jgi:transposase
VLMAKAAEWTKRVAEWRASGVQAQEFCAGRGYSAKCLWHWSSKLGRAGAGASTREPAVRLVRVERQRAAPTPSAASDMVVEIDGVRLILHGQVDAQALRTVMTTLRTLSVEGSR